MWSETIAREEVEKSDKVNKGGGRVGSAKKQWEKKEIPSYRFNANELRKEKVREGRKKAPRSSLLAILRVNKGPDPGGTPQTCGVRTEGPQSGHYQNIHSMV